MGFRIRPKTRRLPGVMNKLEKSYAEWLEVRMLLKEVVAYRYEAIKFRLADKTFYTPDFMVTFQDRIEFHETKGFWEDDAKVKIKMVATLFPEFGFVAVYWKQKQWIYEEF